MVNQNTPPKQNQVNPSSSSSIQNPTNNYVLQANSQPPPPTNTTTNTTNATTSSSNTNIKLLSQPNVNEGITNPPSNQILSQNVPPPPQGQNSSPTSGAYNLNLMNMLWNYSIVNFTPLLECPISHSPSTYFSISLSSMHYRTFYNYWFKSIFKLILWVLFHFITPSHFYLCP